MAKSAELAAPGPPGALWLGDMTAEELAAFDGSDEGKPILLAVRGAVYDVTAGRDFYGPEGGYKVYAGRDASRSLAIMSLKVEDISSSLQGLTEKQLTTLAKWEEKFRKKYPVVGSLSRGVDCDEVVDPNVPRYCK